MPHCIVEYSTDLEDCFNPFILLDLVYQGAFNSNLFEGPDIKIRALPYVYYQTGEKKTGIYSCFHTLIGWQKRQG